MIYKHKTISILVVAILFFSCSIYSFKGSLPPNVKTVYIPPIINSTSEYRLSNMLNDKINEELIKKNILGIAEFYNSDSKLDITINSVHDSPSSYTSNIDNYEVIKQWKLNIQIHVTWHNNHENSIILDKTILEWAMYDNSGLDIGIDNIDNDSDGLIDSEDSDEYGSSREAALRITADKITERIMDELISNW